MSPVEKAIWLSATTKKWSGYARLVWLCETTSRGLCPSKLCSNCYLCSGNFSVCDPPSTLDPNLPDVAKFLSVHFENNSDFYKFGAELVNDKILDVKVIQQDSNKKLGDKCLGLIELWISSVKAPKWQDLIEAASKSGFGGLATALTEELDSQKEPRSGSVEKLDIRSKSGYGGKYT